MIKRLKALLFICFAFGHSLYGQDPYHYLIDKTSGLPSNSVYDIFQDKTGYIWFATDEGLCRYDGTKYTSFSGDAQTSKAGSCIAQDRFGRIWYSNFDGYIYYVEAGRLHALHNKKPSGYFKYGIDDNYLYIVAEKGVSVYDIETLQFIKCIAIKDSSISSASMIDDRFYVVGDFLYEISDGKLVRKLPFVSKVAGNSVFPVIIQKIAQGLVFISKNTSAHQLLNTDGKLVRFKRPNAINFVQNVTVTADGLWLCNPKGACLVDKFEHYKSYFSSFNISSVFKDRKNNYWFASVNKGVLLVPDFTNKLIEMKSRPVKVRLDKDLLYISTEDDAIYQMDLKGNSVKLLHRGDSNHAINQLFVDRQTGHIIFSSNTFNVLSKQRKKIINARIAIKEVDKVDGKYFSFAASGSFGLFTVGDRSFKSNWDTLFKAQENTIHHFSQAALMSNVNAKSTSYNVVHKTIYYATNLGLYYVNLNAAGEIRYKNEVLYIKNLVSYGENTFALSTDGKLYQISNKQRIVPVTLSDKYVIKGAHRISKSNSLMIIYATSGLYAYDMATKLLNKLSNSYQDFDVTDVVDAGGHLIMATSKGMLIDNKQSQKSNYLNQFLIEEVTVNNRAVAKTELNQLSYRQHNVEIDYALLAFTPKEKSDIYYKLNDDKWLPLASQSGSLKLSSLSPGKYKVVFKVDGLEVERVSFTINKPLWLSFWFISSLCGLLIIAGYLISKFKIEQNNRRNQLKLDRVSLENNLNQSKLKAIKSQMNPHFFYNALNTIQSFVLANEKKQAVNYLSKFANLTRTILEMSEKEEVSLAEEIRTIGFYLDIEKARFDNDFEYQIIELGIGNKEELKIPSMLLQPYLENAVKHGLLHKAGPKQLKITFENSNNQLIVRIDDNGIGRKKSIELNKIKQGTHKSFATEAIQSRIDLINENKKHKITVEYIDKIAANDQSMGTTVIIKFPLN
ncbi:sensor histidine kinase [Pedobacter sp.]